MARSCGQITKLMVMLVSVVVFSSIIGHQLLGQLRGKESSHEVVVAYLKALQHSDTKSLLQLTPPDYISDTAVREQLERLGGNKFEKVTIDFRGGTIGGFWTATIHGTRITPNGRWFPYTDQIGLQERQGKWYILLGRQNSPLPPVDSSPLEIVRPSEQP